MKKLIQSVGRVSLVAALAIAGIGAVLPGTASAAGTSKVTNGCYVQWWDTAWVGRCANATATGNYRAIVARADQSDYTGPWRWVGAGSRTDFDSGEAWRGVQSSGNRVDFTN